MIEVSVRDSQLNKAKIKAKEMGKLGNSITHGKGNIAGFLGEIIVSDFMGYSINNTYDYDLISPCGKKIDVKTKRTNYKPKPFYDCSIAAYNTKQKCDQYVFVRVLNDFSKAWILGSKSKEEYFRDARFLKKGSIDPSNNFTVKADCYNLRIDQLD